MLHAICKSSIVFVTIRWYYVITAREQDPEKSRTKKEIIKMKNTTNTNGTVKTNENVKAGRTSKRFIASICAVAAAASMATGIAVFSASATSIKNAPQKPAVSTSAAANDSSSKADTASKTTSYNALTKAADKFGTSSKHPGESGYNYYQNESASVNAQGKHPGESGYNYYQNEQAAVNAQGKHPGESGYYYYQNEQSVVNPQGKHPGESGYYYYQNEQTANAMGKHPGECGFNYQAVMDNYNANVTPALIPAGRYIAFDGARAELVIAKPDEATCYCTVTMGNSYNNEIVYGFMGVANGSEINYTTGTKNDMTYNEDGSIAKGVELSSGHSGTIRKTDSGAFVWKDSDGTCITFTLAK